MKLHRFVSLAACLSLVLVAGCSKDNSDAENARQAPENPASSSSVVSQGETKDEIRPAIVVDPTKVSEPCVAFAYAINGIYGAMDAAKLGDAQAVLTQLGPAKAALPTANKPINDDPAIQQAQSVLVLGATAVINAVESSADPVTEMKNAIELLASEEASRAADTLGPVLYGTCGFDFGQPK